MNRSPTTKAPGRWLALALAAGVLAACGEAPARVETRESGLYIEHLREGTGGAPEPGRYVAIHYVARLDDGTVVDDSLSRDEPFLFGLVEPLLVLPGLAEGVQAMRAGGRARLTLPAELAYGNLGKAPRIPPDAALIYDVELLEVLPRTDSGLHYYLRVEGEGEPPHPGEIAVVRVKGIVPTSGREFLDAEMARGFELRIGERTLQTGFDEGLCLLRPGSQAVFFVPPSLGYGERGLRPKIPPRQDLRFDVEYLGVRRSS